MDRAAMPGVVCVSLLLIKRIKNLKSHGLESNSESDPSGSWRKSFVGRLLLHWSCVWDSTNDPHLPEVNAAGDIDVFDSIFWCITRCGTRTIGDKLFVAYASPVVPAGIVDVCDLHSSVLILRRVGG